MRQMKKTMQDFPLLGYRVSKDLKDHYDKIISDEVTRRNKKLKSNEKKFKKNEIFIEILSHGIKKI